MPKRKVVRPKQKQKEEKEGNKKKKFVKIGDWAFYLDDETLQPIWW